MIIIEGQLLHSADIRLDTVEDFCVIKQSTFCVTQCMYYTCCGDYKPTVFLFFSLSSNTLTISMYSLFNTLILLVDLKNYSPLVHTGVRVRRKINSSETYLTG